MRISVSVCGVLGVLLISTAAAQAKAPKMKAKDLLLPRSGFPEVTEAQAQLDQVPYHPGAPAVVLLSSEEHHWEGWEFKRDRHFRRVKILDESAIEEHGTYEFRLWGDWRVQKVEARTVLPDGTVVDAADGINRQTSESGLQVIQVAFPQVQVGAILDSNIVISSDGLGVDPWILQDTLPVLDARFMMRPPLGLQFQIAPYRLPAEMAKPDYSLNIAGGEKAHVWRRTDVEAIPDLAHLPPVADVSQRLFVILRQFKTSNAFFAIAGDWKTYGEVRRDSWDDWFQKGHAAVDALAQQVAGGEGTAVDKAEAVRKALQERYEPDFVARWASQDTPDEELAAGRGTTGGMAALATRMLRAVGVDADLVTLRRRSRGIVPAEFPVPQLMNDLMVRIPDGNGGHLFFSPASDMHVSKVPYDCRGVLAMPFDGEADKPVIIEDYTANQNQTLRVVRGKLDADGRLQATSTQTYKGVAAEVWRERLRDQTEEQRKIRVEDSLQRFMPSLALTGLEIRNLDDVEKDLVLECEWNVEDFATAAGKRLLFNPNIYARVDPADWAPEQRDYEVDLGRNYELIDTLMVTLPDGVRDISVPDAVRYPADPVGLYETEYGRQGPMLIAKRHARIDMYRLPVQSYAGLRKWFADIAAVDEKPIAIELP